MAGVETPKPLPTLLLERGLLSAQQLQAAQAQVAQTGVPLRRVLLQQHLVAEEALAQLVAAQAGLVYVDLATQRIRPEVLALISADVARQHVILPVFRIEETLTIAMADPLNVFVTDELRLRTHCDIKRIVASETNIRQAIERWYGPAKGGTLTAPDPEENGASPAIHALDALLQEAQRWRAQTLTLEVAEGQLHTRLRVDGVLHAGPAFPLALHDPLLMRLKALAGLNMLQRQKPQEGECRVRLEGHELRVRVSIVPGRSGETVTLQLQDLSQPALSLEQLGMEASLREELLQALKRSPGPLLVTAVAEAELMSVLEALVMAAQAAGLRVTRVSVAPGQPVAAALEAAPRKDTETLICGMQARNDLEVRQRCESLKAGLLGLLTVRMARRLCPQCALPYQPAAAVAREWQIAEQVALFKSQGCPACHHTGFQGQVGLFAWRPDPTGAGADGALRQAARRRVREGLTAIEEANRVLGEPLHE